MWSIGIKSGIITVIGIIVSGLILETMHLETLLWCKLKYVLLAIGIYLGHYSYKVANNGFMSYKQGLKVGLITTVFTGLFHGLSSYMYTKFVDLHCAKYLLATINQDLLQTNPYTLVAKTWQFIQENFLPEVLSITIVLSNVLLGFIFTLVITGYASHPKKVPRT